LIIVINKQIKDKKNNNQFIKHYINENLELKNKLEETLEKVIIDKRSIEDIKNGIEFYNKLQCKKYIRIGTIKENRYSKIEQNIVVIIYEEDIIYKMNYWKDKVKINEIYDINNYISNLALECRVYVDGTVIDPMLLSKLYIGDKEIKIEEINLGRNVGRGIGTLIIQLLSDILPNYGIDQLIAPISSVDYSVKERLYKFYCVMNGFKMEREVTKDKWGVAIKYINK